MQLYENAAVLHNEDNAASFLAFNSMFCAYVTNNGRQRVAALRTDQDPARFHDLAKLDGAADMAAVDRAIAAFQ